MDNVNLASLINANAVPLSPDMQALLDEVDNYSYNLFEEYGFSSLGELRDKQNIHVVVVDQLPSYKKVVIREGDCGTTYEDEVSYEPAGCYVRYDEIRYANLNPTVIHHQPVVYLKNTSDRYQLACTYVHEMMHAFYDADYSVDFHKIANAIEYIEEPMAECGMLRFIAHFNNNIYRRAALPTVKAKQTNDGIHHYGFGEFLYHHAFRTYINGDETMCWEKTMRDRMSRGIIRDTISKSIQYQEISSSLRHMNYPQDYILRDIANKIIYLFEQEEFIRLFSWRNEQITSLTQGFSKILKDGLWGLVGEHSLIKNLPQWDDIYIASKDSSIIFKSDEEITLVDMACLDSYLWFLSPGYSEVREGIEGSMLVKERANGCIGVIDKCGYIIVPISMKEIKCITDKGSLKKVGYYDVTDWDGKQGIYDKDGNEVLNCAWDAIEVIGLMSNCHRFKVKDKNGYGVFSCTGEQIIPCRWNDVDDDLRVFDGDNYGLYDSEGNTILKCEWKEINFIKRNIIEVYDGSHYGLHDSKGNTILKCKWREINFIAWDIIKVYDGLHYGLINSSGIELIPCYLMSIDVIRTDNHLLKVGDEKQQFGLFSISGAYIKKILECVWASIEIMTDNPTLLLVSDGTHYGMYNDNGTEIVHCNQDSIVAEGYNRYLVKYNDNSWIVDNQGKVVIKQERNSIERIGDSYFIIRDSTNHCGLCDNDGKVILKNEWINIQITHTSYAIVENDDKKWGLIYRDGTMILKCEWECISAINSNKLAVTKDGNTIYYDFYGNLIIRN